jgi:hypothetical protein
MKTSALSDDRSLYSKLKIVFLGEYRPIHYAPISDTYQKWIFAQWAATGVTSIRLLLRWLSCYWKVANQRRELLRLNPHLLRDID